MSDGDRVAARVGVAPVDGFPALLVDVDPATYDSSYDVVCNQILWFVHHGLFDRMGEPTFRPHHGEGMGVLPGGQRGIRGGGRRARTVRRLRPGPGLPPGAGGAVGLRPPTRPAARPLPPPPSATPSEFSLLPTRCKRPTCSPGWLRITSAASTAIAGRRPSSPAANRCSVRARPRWSPRSVSDPDDTAAAQRCPVRRGDATPRRTGRRRSRHRAGRPDRTRRTSCGVRGLRPVPPPSTPSGTSEVTFVASIYPSRQNLSPPIPGLPPGGRDQGCAGEPPPRPPKTWHTDSTRRPPRFPLVGRTAPSGRRADGQPRPRQGSTWWRPRVRSSTNATSSPAAVTRSRQLDAQLADVVIAVPHPFDLSGDGRCPRRRPAPTSGADDRQHPRPRCLADLVARRTPADWLHRPAAGCGRHSAALSRRNGASGGPLVASCSGARPTFEPLRGSAP